MLLLTELSSQLEAGQLLVRYIPEDGEDMIRIYETHIFVLRKIPFKQMKTITVMYSNEVVEEKASLIKTQA